MYEFMGIFNADGRSALTRRFHLIAGITRTSSSINSAPGTTTEASSKRIVVTAELAVNSIDFFDHFGSPPLIDCKFSSLLTISSTPEIRILMLLCKALAARAPRSNSTRYRFPGLVANDWLMLPLPVFPPEKKRAHLRPFVAGNTDWSTTATSPPLTHDRPLFSKLPSTSNGVTNER